MPGPLNNERHERMAQELAKGADQSAAHRLAGFSGKRAAASEMAARPEIQARVTELLERGAKRAEITVADIARQLDEDRAFAREKLAPAAAVTATMGKAKVLGLIIDRTQRELSEEQLKAILDMVASNPGVAQQLLAQLS
jgi:hypothetical protein